jgi:hypothetical protein
MYMSTFLHLKSVFLYNHVCIIFNTASHVGRLVSAYCNVRTDPYRRIGDSKILDKTHLSSWTHKIRKRGYTVMFIQVAQKVTTVTQLRLSSCRIVTNKHFIRLAVFICKCLFLYESLGSFNRSRLPYTNIGVQTAVRR